jgi:DNA-binding Xre family transcriptional regulator
MEAICRAYGVTPGDVLECVPDGAGSDRQPA